MKVLLSFAFLAWFFLVLFFVNRAQVSSCGTDSDMVARPLVDTGIPIIAFDHYSTAPKTSAAFDFLRDSLQRQLQATDKLKITGQFTQTESDTDSNIGLKRANAIRSLFGGYVNLNRIEIEAKLSQKVSTVPTFEILRDKITRNALDIPLPMMDNQTKVKEEVSQKVELSKQNQVKDSPTERSNSADYIVYFNDESSQIIGSSDVQQYLDALSKRVKSSKEIVEILGYDDNSRSTDESLELAKRRTWRVRKAFSDDFVRRKLVKVKNIGQTDPIAPNETPEGRSKNRRVEIRILIK